MKQYQIAFGLGDIIVSGKNRKDAKEKALEILKTKTIGEIGVVICNIESMCEVCGSIDDNDGLCKCYDEDGLLKTKNN